MTGKPRAGRPLLTVSALVVIGAIAAACGPAFSDGFEVEGVWVGNRSWTVSECVAQRCEPLAKVAAGQLLGREPAVRIHDVRFHDQPHELADGRSITSTLEVWNVVFTLEDGFRRLEAFSCHLGTLVSGASVYGQFCSPRMGSAPN